MSRSNTNNNDPRVIVALDYPNAEQAMNLVSRLSPAMCRLKVGKELFTSAGPALVERLVALGYDVFLDLKFHDIPNTVHKAVTAAIGLGVWMVNVHALGGRDMLLAAREAIDLQAVKATHLIAVSVLTSTNQAGLEEIGIHKSIEQEVNDLTALSLECGLDGMVCSALEAKGLRKRFGTDPLLVTPGIRPAGAENDDQQRIMTPRRAIDNGSSYLVIGRPVTAHSDPLQQLENINQSLLAQA
jgi:orotidine-5'-phosphate decarboxylase